MRFTIASDIPGRIRVRYGQRAFSEGQAHALEVYFASLTGVVYAKVGFHTGSVLVVYVGNLRETLLLEFAHPRIPLIDPLPVPHNEKLVLIDAGFRKRLFLRLVWRVLRRLILPAPARTVLTFVKAFSFIRRGIASLGDGQLGMEVLDAAAVSAAMIQGNFNSASSIMFLLSISEMLEKYALRRTREILLDSLRIHADTVWIEENGVERLIPMSELRVNDQVVVRTGAAIPVDGTVLRGEAVVNESAMTGEPMGRFKEKGDSVFAGTVLEEGALVFRARTLESNTRFHQIVQLIGEAETLKANVQSRAERIADKLVPFSFLLSATVLLVTQSLTKALSVLLVDYSCAIKLSTPISVLSAMRDASEQGIVVKGGRFLEVVAEADTFVFDKTGTLTLATPSVSRVTPFSPFSREDVLRLAACMEEHFPHSVASAIVRAAQEEQLQHEEQHAEVEYIAAHGIATTIFGYRAIIGSRHFVFEDEGVPLSDAHRELLDSENGSVICLAVDGQFAGFISIHDPLRDEAATVVAGLRELGVRQIIMLTGDSEATARDISHQLGLDHYRAQILPADKAEVIDTLRKQGHKVVMVGDGINDSPALARADASIAMQDASDLARDVADITLMHSDLRQILLLRKLGQALMKKITGNYRFIAVFNTSVLLGGIMGALTPGTLALLHNLSTIAVCANSMRPGTVAPD
ncbi:MAG: heavy metal translocating P-type ATPase [Burkholderiaceae bacterium]|jgi:heavy metal translocating P-type ATPase|nr:heavy metal translocating P-type ATPase [Burkholderiaceae bacterium]